MGKWYLNHETFYASILGYEDHDEWLDHEVNM